MAATHDDSMRYGMVGEDASSDAEKLAKYAGEVGWDYLRPHYQSGVLYFVDPGLRLEKVGAAFSADNKKAVQAWLKHGDLVRIEALHAMQWENTENERHDRAVPRFEALVVSPFVLFRPMP
jgi:hypothetical protein